MSLASAASKGAAAHHVSHSKMLIAAFSKEVLTKLALDMTAPVILAPATKARATQASYAHRTN
eukprot:6190585-Pleurochrysis_carterae.AAC.3